MFKSRQYETARSPQGWAYNIETRHCPNCGAPMDAESEEEG